MFLEEFRHTSAVARKEVRHFLHLSMSLTSVKKGCQSIVFSIWFEKLEVCQNAIGALQDVSGRM